MKFHYMFVKVFIHASQVEVEHLKYFIYGGFYFNDVYIIVFQIFLSLSHLTF